MKGLFKSNSRTELSLCLRTFAIYTLPLGSQQDRAIPSVHQSGLKTEIKIFLGICYWTGVLIVVTETQTM